MRYPVSLSMVELNLASLCASSMLMVSPQRATCPARPFAMEKRNSFSPSRNGSSGAFDWPKIHETRFLLRPWLAPRVTISSPLSRSTKNSVQRSQSWTGEVRAVGDRERGRNTQQHEQRPSEQAHGKGFSGRASVA